MTEETKQYQNIIPGHGRNKGSLNKKTIIRNQALRDYLIENDAIRKILGVVLQRLEVEPDMLKTADLMQAFKALQPYLGTTVSEELAAERLDTVIESIDPEKTKTEIIDLINAVTKAG